MDCTPLPIIVDEIGIEKGLREHAKLGTEEEEDKWWARYEKEHLRLE